MMIKCLSSPLCMHGTNRSVRLQQPCLVAPHRIHLLSSISRHRSGYRPTVVLQAAGSDVPERSAGAEEAILKLTDSLRLLETERDEAVKTAESCARTAVKLEEMTRLLEKLALDKVSEGDESGAKEVLKEKAAVSEVMSRTSSRAQTNFSLATKLAEKIGQQQADLMTLLAGRKNSSSSSSSCNSSRVIHTGSTATSSAGSGFDSSSAAAATSTTSSSSSSGRYEAPWEKSLAEARARIKQAEEDAAAAAATPGSAASWAARRPRESLEEARDRLRSEAWQSVSAARSRIRQSASESIEQARARIAAEDAAVLSQVHELITRYKSGGYVPEDELDWAFRQLERRSWRN